MLRILNLLFCSLLTVHSSFAQQYGWTDISGNLPDYPFDTTIINNGEDTLIANLSDISFINDDEGWITTWHAFNDENAAILHTTDGGESWEVQTVMRPCQVIHMVDLNVGYAGSDGGLIFKTSDGGANWVFHGITGAPITGISFVPGSDTGYICSYAISKMHQVTPQGINVINFDNAPFWWKSLSAPSHELIWLSMGTSVYTFDQEGLTDQPVTSANYNSICFNRNDLGWGCGNEGVKDRNPGIIAGCVGKNIDWVHLKYTEQSLNDVFALDENHVWAVGFEGYIYYSENASEFDRDSLTSEWWSNVIFTSQVNPRSDADFHSVFFTSPQNGFVSGGKNVVLKYTQITGVEDRGGMEAWGHGSVEVWPNPTHGKFQITSTKFQTNSNFQIQNGIVEVVDLFGKVLMEAGRLGSWEAGMEFDVSFLPAGIYFIRISLSDSIIVNKIVKL